MSSKKILVVEDDEDVRLGLAESLQKNHFAPITASEGTGAIQRLLEHRDIDTIVTDIRMPIFGGDYWLSFLETFCLPRYRIILASARQLDTVPTGMRYLRKPYSFEELLGLLK